jgi:SPP1 family predicted phage head-tail adaptor
VQAGSLDNIISIEQKSVARDSDYGGEVITWAALYSNIPAQQLELGGAEKVRMGLRVATRHMQFTVRWRTGITTDMRVKSPDGRLFAIVSASEIPRHRGVVIVAEEYSSG